MTADSSLPVPAGNTDPAVVEPAPADSSDREAILEDIERTREQMGQTVQALAAKTDVKARAQDKAVEVKTKAQAKAAEVKAKAQAKAAEVTGTVPQQAKHAATSTTKYWPEIAAAAGAAGAVLVGWLTIRRRRR